MTAEMKHSEIFRAAKEYIREGWTQGKFARNAEGDECAADDYQATCWCLDGAVGAAEGLSEGSSDKSYEIMQVVAEQYYPEAGNPIRFNDRTARSADDVLWFLDKCEQHCLAYYD